MKQKDQPILTLSVAAQLLELHPRTLMLYEKEGLTSPHRTTTNRRLYSAEDLAHIQFIQYLVDEKGVNISGVRTILELLEKAKNKYQNPKEELFPDFEEKELI